MRTLVIGLSLVVAASLPLSAEAGTKLRKHSPERTVTRTVTAHYVEGPGAFDGIDCRPSRLTGTAPWAACRFHYPIDSTFDAGDITGETHTDIVAWLDPDGRIRYEGIEYVTGTISGCGTGTFIIDIPYGWVDFKMFDPQTQSAPGYNTWFIRSGSGTGGLSRLVSGGGINHWTTYPLEQDPEAKRFGDGVFSGEVTCRVPRERATSQRRARRPRERERPRQDSNLRPAD